MKSVVESRARVIADPEADRLEAGGFNPWVENETVSLAVPHGTKLIYFDRLESHWPFQVNLQVGEGLPFHCRASGKLYVSTLPIDQAMGIFDRISKKTSARNTIVAGAMFERALLEMRETGFALDDQEWFDDM